MNHPAHSQEAAIKPWATERKDSWRTEPTLVAIGFTLFIIYATYRAFVGQYYETDNYLSPFYSPKLMFDWWKWSPAILILWMPAGFRATCYYYRKAYYRAYFQDPPGCGVGHLGGHSYTGETKFPFVMQNLHRYMLYLAILVIGFLWYDTINSFFAGADFWKPGAQFRIGIGSIIYLVNVLLLSAYTFGCHAFRHLVGGRYDCFTCPAGGGKSEHTKLSYKIWKWVTHLNEHHMRWAWLSLFSVMAADLYTSYVVANHFNDTISGPNLRFEQSEHFR
jgi:hypothetical protein